MQSIHHQTFIQSIQLRNFRSFAVSAFHLSPGINVIHGPNGIGKTNLLEALYFATSGRSFKSINLTEMIHHGKDHFQLETSFQNSSIDQTIRIFYDGSVKKIKHNETIYSGFSSLIGLLPLTLYAPSDILLITGSPSQKRRFLNLQIASQNTQYLIHLARYHRALKQRNVLLKQRKTHTIEIWEEELIRHAEPITHLRNEHIQKLSFQLQKELNTLTESSDKEAEISYIPSTKEFLSREHFDKTRSKELQFGYTLYGPHRDDFQIMLNKIPAKLYASEGEKRLLIVSLKLAAHFCKEASIFAIDDFGVHLDPKRVQILEEKLIALPQVIITATTPLKEVHPAHVIDLGHSVKQPAL